MLDYVASPTHPLNGEMSTDVEMTALSMPSRPSQSWYKFRTVTTNREYVLDNRAVRMITSKLEAHEIMPNDAQSR